jgi:hypothetical protein
VKCVEDVGNDGIVLPGAGPVPGRAGAAVPVAGADCVYGNIGPGPTAYGATGAPGPAEG